MLLRFGWQVKEFEDLTTRLHTEIDMKVWSC